MMDKYYSNKDFTVFFPEKKIQCLFFYYTVINTKPLVYRIFLKLLICLGMHNSLYYFCGINNVGTLDKIGLSSYEIVVAVKQKILQKWSNNFKLGKPEDMFFLIVKRGPRKMLFLFADNLSIPFACAKLTSTGDSYSAFLREFTELQYLQKEASDYCKASVPRPLFKIECGEELAIVMSYIDGKAISPSRIKGLKLSNFGKDRKIIQKVYCWWKSFLEPSYKKIQFDKQSFIERLNINEVHFFTSFPNDMRMGKEFSYLKGKLEQLHETNTWLGPVHGDFWKGNMLYKDKNIHVIDWERSKKNGLPIFDLFLFCATFYDENDMIQAFSKTFIENTNCSLIIREMLRNAIAYLCLDSVLAKIMFEVFLIEMCVQGHIHYNKKIKFDVEWKARLDFFLDNKEIILSRNFNSVI